MLVCSASMISLFPTIVCFCRLLVLVLRCVVRCLCGVGVGVRCNSNCLGVCGLGKVVCVVCVVVHGIVRFLCCIGTCCLRVCMGRLS